MSSKHCTKSRRDIPILQFQKVARNSSCLLLATYVSCRSRVRQVLNSQAPLTNHFTTVQPTTIVPLRRQSSLPSRFVLSPLSTVCHHCQAVHFLEEVNDLSTVLNPQFLKCCMSGKVSLPSPQEPPKELFQLFTSNDSSMLYS
jgi:hypothetical protein